ncbi:NTP transferase domain-containing protein, partial [Methanoregula sp.]|uniref:NTP transferase domain-containing protein n=1 Tax=Methanoregula sp. TaxID=2052170 RepID=UPI000CACC573
MLALIMAGGQGSRLGLGEKPLVQVLNRPMISYVIDAFEEAGLDVIVVAAPNTRYTQNWCRAQGISLVLASGRGYVEDLEESVTGLGAEGPLFTCGGDLAGISPHIIQRIKDEYEKSPLDACSVWVPLSLSRSLGLEPA